MNGQDIHSRGQFDYEDIASVKLTSILTALTDGREAGFRTGDGIFIHMEPREKYVAGDYDMNG
jgi:hypothetical protein